MAVYKVIQDVEAEDKLVGPLTLRQFIYAFVAVGLGYLCFFLIVHGAAIVTPPLLLVVVACGFFAFPWGRDQPTELWALAKVRFYFKARRRVWDQSGVKQLVTITVPKKVRINYTNGLSQTEVKSRLQALADTLDSRGWAVRNANPTSPNQVVQAIGNQSDRLVVAAPAPVPAIETDVQDADDVMDSTNNPIAKQFDAMITASAQTHRQQIIDSIQQTVPAPASSPQPASPSGRWFLGQPMRPSIGTPQNAVTFNEQVVTPTPVPATSSDGVTPDEEELIKKLDMQEKATAVTYAHLHTIQPLSVAASMQPPPQQQTTPAVAAQPATQSPPPTPQTSSAPQTGASVTQSSGTGILDLAGNNDLNVATIAREAQKRRPQDEIVISLH